MDGGDELSSSSMLQTDTTRIFGTRGNQAPKG